MAETSALKSRKFIPLFWTQFFGAFNDNFLKNALVILVTYRSVTVLGLPPTEIVILAGGIFILPFFLFSTLAGQIADKFEKGKVIRWIKAAEIGIMALAAYGLISEHFIFCLIVLFLMGLHSTFFGPIKYSILPQHLGPNEMVAGNARIEAGTFLAILLGTISGGLLIALPAGTTIVSIGLIAVAIIGFATSWLVPEAPAIDSNLKIRFNPIRPTLEMFGFARQSRSVFLSILGISWFWLFGAAILSLFPPLVKDVLSGDEGVVTLFLAMFSIGIAVGSFLCEKFSKHRLELGLVPLGSIGISVFGILLWHFCAGGIPHVGTALLGPRELISTHQGVLILADLFLLSVFSGFFIVPLYTLMQERSAAKHRSRVIAANNILNALFMVVSSGILIVLHRLGLSIPQIILALAVGNAFVAVYIYFLLPEFLLRFLAWILANVIYRVRTVGHSSIPEKGAAVLVANHVSFVDWLILLAAVRRPVRFVMDHSFFRGLILKHLMTEAKVIPIASAKENQEILDQAFERIAEELESGELVCIFPEGIITFDGEMGPFRPGILKIIGRTPVPVIPVALNNLWGSFFSRKDLKILKKRPRKFWHKITVRIGKPVLAAAVTLELLEKQVAELHTQE
jgi:1-acyl-sn-glycerol-3-phosphate acyltransferase